MSQEDNGSSSGLRGQQSQNDQRNLEVLESRWKAEKRVEGSDPRCETLQGVTVWLLPKERSPRWMRALSRDAGQPLASRLWGSWERGLSLGTVKF